MVKDLTEVRSPQKKHMSDTPGSDIHVPTALRGIVKTASLNPQHTKLRRDKPTRKRVQPRNRMRENRTAGTVWGVPGDRYPYQDTIQK